MPSCKHPNSSAKRRKPVSASGRSRKLSSAKTLQQRQAQWLVESYASPQRKGTAKVVPERFRENQFGLRLNPSKCTVAPLGGAALLKYVAVRVRLWPGSKVT